MSFLDPGKPAKNNSPDISRREDFVAKIDPKANKPHDEQEGAYRNQYEKEETAMTGWGAPNAGARETKGKTNQPTSVMTDAPKTAPSAVTTVDRDKNKGAALKAGMKQRTGTYDGAEDSNPKHQPASFKE